MPIKASLTGIRAKHQVPIFTLWILTKHVHIINSPDLIIAVQKNPKAFDFSVFVNLMLPRLFDVDSKTMQLANTPIERPEGRWDLVVETGRVMHRYLGPGPSLEKMERIALTRFLGFFDELAAEADGTVVDMFAWLRTAMTVTSTDAVSMLLYAAFPCLLRADGG